jgi:hypothetical protein
MSNYMEVEGFVIDICAIAESLHKISDSISVEEAARESLTGKKTTLPCNSLAWLVGSLLTASNNLSQAYYKACDDTRRGSHRASPPTQSGA